MMAQELCITNSAMETDLYLAGNSYIPPFALNKQYAAKRSNTQRVGIESAGPTIPTLGKRHTPGTSIAFLLLSLIWYSLVSRELLRSKKM
jgi:hypothetical protein